MRRRQATGTGAAQSFDNIGERHAWARAHDGMFDGVDNEWITEGDDEKNHQSAQSRAGIAEPQSRHERNDDAKHKPAHDAVAAAQNRHEPVEERIAQRAVDKMEQARIERLQPMHGRQCSGK